MSDAWRTSSYSGSQANCVEVGNAATLRVGLIMVRDTKDRPGTTLTVTADAWRRFTASVRD